MSVRKKSKLDALYPERRLQFGEIVVVVRAVPGLRAADLVEAFDLAREKVVGQTWAGLSSEVWPKIRDIISDCVEFVDDDPDVTLDRLPIVPLGEIVQAVRDLTFESAGSLGNPAALPQAIGKMYGLVWESRQEEVVVKGTAETAEPTS
jgi:hypothetical protein